MKQIFDVGVKILLLLFVFLLGRPVYAGGGPENVLLVVNAESQSSLLLANHYISLRDIPERNVVYLSGIKNRELISLNEFRDTILKPIFEAVQERKLSANIDYIVYSADFPCMVSVSSHQKKLMSQKDANGRTMPESNKKIFNAHASINSLTYFATAVLQDQPGYMLLNSNYYYRVPAAQILKTPFLGDDQARYQAAIKAGAAKNYSDAIEGLTSLAQENPGQIAVLYSLARFCALEGDFDQAAVWLKRAVQHGWIYESHTSKDEAFRRAIDNFDFRKVLEDMPDQPFEFSATQGFSHTTAWAPNGSRNGDRKSGRQYVLSTVLGVTRNYGCTEKAALAALKRNAIVDGTQPRGTFYFADTKDVRNRTRKPNYLPALQALRALGQKTKVINTVIPVNQKDVIGLTNGTPNFKWKTSGSEILPGAICDNLTSHGGMLNRQSQTKCTSFIAYGAAGASGTVIEPYAIQAKFPHPMIHVHYARGCSLAESFYQSVHGPFQLLIVGDALCQPFAIPPVFESEGLKPRTKITGRITAELDFTNSAVDAAAVEFYVDGRLIHRRPVGENIGVDTTKIPDGYHEIRIVAIGDDFIQARGAKVYPIFVDNHGHRVNVSLAKKEFDLKEKLTIKVESNYGVRIELKQNFRTIDQKDGKEVTFEIPATKLGRGPVQLMAIAYDENDIPVMSVPYAFDINGPIAETKESTEGATKPKK